MSLRSLAFGLLFLSRSLLGEGGGGAVMVNPNYVPGDPLSPEQVSEMWDCYVEISEGVALENEHCAATLGEERCAGKRGKCRWLATRGQCVGLAYTQCSEPIRSSCHEIKLMT